RRDAQALAPELGRDSRCGRRWQAADREARRRRQGAPTLMSISEPAARAGPPSPAPPPPDGLVLAMDVVDTLRHRERLVERELNEEQLIERLRSLYKGQGIEV